MDLIHRGADAGYNDDGTFVIITLTPLFMQEDRQHCKVRQHPWAQLFASYMLWDGLRSSAFLSWTCLKRKVFVILFCTICSVLKTPHDICRNGSSRKTWLVNLTLRQEESKNLLNGLYLIIYLWIEWFDYSGFLQGNANYQVFDWNLNQLLISNRVSLQINYILLVFSIVEKMTVMLHRCKKLEIVTYVHKIIFASKSS